MADFVVVYLMEAHAKDQWPLGSHVEIEQHKNLEERIAAAEAFIQRFDCKVPVLIDTMSNQFNDLFAAWPERFFVIHNMKMRYIAQPSLEDKGFNLEEVNEFLSSHSRDALRSQFLF